jgi:hypothetical protein
MELAIENPAGRKGRFLWMDDSSKRSYLESLSHKMRDGYFFSEKVIARLVDELAPSFSDTLQEE